MLNIPLVVIVVLVVLMLIACLLALSAFFLGRLFQEQKEATINSRVAMGLSVYAAIEAKSVKNSTVINRIIEKYNLIKKDEEPSAALARVEAEIEEQMGLLSEEEIDLRNKAAKRKKDLHDFDDIDAKDLV